MGNLNSWKWFEFGSHLKCHLLIGMNMTEIWELRTPCTSSLQQEVICQLCSRSAWHIFRIILISFLEILPKISGFANWKWRLAQQGNYTCWLLNIPDKKPGSSRFDTVQYCQQVITLPCLLGLRVKAISHSIHVSCSKQLKQTLNCCRRQSDFVFFWVTTYFRNDSGRRLMPHNL